MKKLILLMLLISTSSFAYEGQIRTAYVLLNPGTLSEIVVQHIDLREEKIDLTGKSNEVLTLKQYVTARIGNAGYLVKKIDIKRENNKIKVTGLYLVEPHTQKTVNILLYADGTSARLRLDEQTFNFRIHEKF